jgi:phage terminase small subunit
VTRTGRPPKPLEIKRRTGRAPGRDSGGRALPEPAEIVALPMADGVPDASVDLALDGRRLWEQVWTAGATWISPATDMATVEQAALLADDVAIARRRYHATSDPKDAAALARMAKALVDALSALGFDPTSRSRLGVAEVKRVSALAELRARHANRSG